MRIDRSTRLFLDASCLIAAAGNPVGGSGTIVEGCQRGFLQAVVNVEVLRESERNIAKKLGVLVQARYLMSLKEMRAEVVVDPPEPELLAAGEIVGAKDAHVLACALAADTPLLISLDKKLVAAINNEHFSLRALSPEEFIRDLLPNHPDYNEFWG